MAKKIIEEKVYLLLFKLKGKEQKDQLEQDIKQLKIKGRKAIDTAFERLEKRKTKLIENLKNKGYDVWFSCNVSSGVPLDIIIGFKGSLVQTTSDFFNIARELKLHYSSSEEGWFSKQ